MVDCCCYLWNMITDLSVSSIADILVAITSVIALCLSVKSYIRENKNRKKDENQRIKQQEKEDAIRKWNALYPHRLEFYTSFYDYLFKLLNCNKHRSPYVICKELKDYCAKFNKLTEDSKVLFDDEIYSSVRRVYDLLYAFLNNNHISIEGQAKAVKNLWGKKEDKFTNKLDSLLQEVKNAKLDTDLRNKFLKVFKMEGNKDE